ncbi:MAG: hypothetical protein LKF13_07955 [Atopobiaceae bacterium]|nr:hypothetical protein [Atopobiaceae bacterium]
MDTRLVLNTFLSKVMDQPGWEVLENGMIGLFSFSQFVMWNDIHSHEDELRQSKVVASLMDGRLAWQAEPIDPDEKVDPSELLLLPAEADASQMARHQEGRDRRAELRAGTALLARASPRPSRCS